MRLPRFTKDGWLIIAAIVFAIGMMVAIFTADTQECTQVNVHFESGQVNAEVCR